MVEHTSRRQGILQSMETLKERQEAAQEIDERGGIDFATAMANLGAGYAFSSPEIRTRRTKSDVRQDLPGREYIGGGFKLSSTVPKDAEPGVYYDANAGDFVQIYRGEPTRNRPEGMLVRKIRPVISAAIVDDINDRLKIKQEIIYKI